ncbi:hypothetical protein BJX66DRAFT_147471 [Aspergillus keveii]|uniref:Secreted protein n=1 Tax=Aspergillus keveii TaxID=714993 RepID=A0ABR4FI44_9EURO
MNRRQLFLLSTGCLSIWLCYLGSSCGILMIPHISFPHADSYCSRTSTFSASASICVVSLPVVRSSPSRSSCRHSSTASVDDFHSGTLRLFRLLKILKMANRIANTSVTIGTTKYPHRIETKGTLSTRSPYAVWLFGP